MSLLRGSGHTVAPPSAKLTVLITPTARRGTLNEQSLLGGSWPALVERDAQLGALDDLARRRSGARMVLITGDAGAGKTRLVREFAARASQLRTTLRLAADTGVLDAPDLPEMVTTVGSADVAFGRALAAALGRYFGDDPGLVLLDDLHRLDPIGIRSLQSVLDLSGDRDLLILTAYRIGAHPSGTSAALAVGDLLRHPATREIAVPPLSVAGVARLAASLDRQLDDAGAVEIHRRTGGNPFFVEQLLFLDDPGVPWSVREAILGQLEMLGPGPRAAVDVLAVADGPLPQGVVDAVLGHGTLRSLVDARVAVGEMEGWVALRHELTGEVVLERIEPNERRRLHAMLAEHLELDGRVPPGRLARHWHLAGESARAASWATIAADHALAHRFYRSATEFYGIATRGDLDGLARAELYNRAAVAAGWAGSEREAITWATEADAAYRAAGETWRAVAMWMSPGLARVPKPTLETMPHAIGSPEQRLATARELVARGEYEHGADLLRQVIDEASDRGETHWEIEAALRLVGAGHAIEGNLVLERVRARAVATSDDATLAHAASRMAYVALACGDAVRALHADRIAATAAARNPETVSWPLDAGVATILALIGRLDEADSLVDELMRTGPPLAAEFAQLPACLVDLGRGDMQTARERISRMAAVDTLAVTQLAIAVRFARAQLELAEGDADAALVTLHEADRLTNEIFEATRLDRLMLRARAAVAVDRESELQSVAVVLDQLSNLHGGREIDAAVNHVRGLIAGRACDPDAPRLLAVAAGQWERSGRIRHASEAWCDVADASRDPQRQDDALDRASHLAHRHKLTPLLDRIGAISRRSEAAGIRSALDQLTERERAIAGRVAKGMTNRQIAAALHISEHTVRNHLVNVYDKLGVARRAELATLLVTHETTR
jgi:DNA-binding CsgD family transcriptional regulator